MRALVKSLVVIGLALAWNASASAQTYGDNYPVCLKVYGPLTYTECRYVSINQCQQSASGRAAQCLENPFFVARPLQKSRRDRQRSPR